MKTDFRILAIQMTPQDNKEHNLRTVERVLDKYDGNMPDFVVLPEMFCCPYENSKFPEYAEKEGGAVWQWMSDTAKKYGCYLIGGSVPELAENEADIKSDRSEETSEFYNTSYVFDREGKQIAKHRKVHLFDVQIKNGQHFRESDTLSAGNHSSFISIVLTKLNPPSAAPPSPPSGGCFRPWRHSGGGSC